MLKEIDVLEASVIHLKALGTTGGTPSALVWVQQHPQHQPSSAGTSGGSSSGGGGSEREEAPSADVTQRVKRRAEAPAAGGRAHHAGADAQLAPPSPPTLPATSQPSGGAPRAAVGGDLERLAEIERWVDSGGA
jgi:hypothetical protein